MFYFWLILIILLAVVEVLTVNLVSIWFIISGFFALVTSFIIDSFLIQFAIFVVLGVILMISTRQVLEEKLVKKEKTNLDRIVGMKGVVTEEINDTNVGEIKVDGKKWSAISNTNLKVGDTVKILNIKGVKLEVERWEE